MAKRLTLYIMIGLALGIVIGAIMHATMTPEAVTEASKWFKMITDIFLRLIKMIVAPLVFATLVAGIVHMGDTTALGRVGAKTIGWFFGATLVSLSLGMILVNVLQPGVDSGLDLSRAIGSSRRSPKWCLNRFSRRWRIRRCCRSSSSRCSSAWR